MKKCPDCAESVQDAARKCRYCGYRFAAAEAASDAAPAATVAASAAPAPQTPPKPDTPRTATGPAVPSGALGFLVLALGGLGMLAAGGVGCVLLVIGPERATAPFAVTSVGGQVLAGASFVIGWLLVARGAHRVGSAALGGVVLLVAIAAAMLWRKELGVELTGLVAAIGLLACLCLHLAPLEAVGFDGTKLAAMLGVLGLGLELLSRFRLRAVDLPTWIWQGFAWIGFLGVLLFGLGLTIESFAKVGRP
jgi:hypothetical protein